MALNRLPAVTYVPKILRKKIGYIDKMKYESRKEVEDFESGRLLLDEARQTRYSSSSSRWVSSLAGLLLLAIAIIAYLSILLLSTLQSPQIASATGRDYGDCGHSIDEAIANGCKFDTTTWAWQRAECYDEELIDDFLSRTDWHFYSNWTLEPADELPLSEVVAGKFLTVYAEKKYHPIHCTYAWRKMHRAWEGNLTLDHVTLPYAHTLHCEKILLIDYTHETECSIFAGCATKLDAIFAKCGHT